MYTCPKCGKITIKNEDSKAVCESCGFYFDSTFVASEDLDKRYAKAIREMGVLTINDFPVVYLGVPVFFADSILYVIRKQGLQTIPYLKELAEKGIINLVINQSKYAVKCRPFESDGDYGRLVFASVKKLLDSIVLEQHLEAPADDTSNLTAEELHIRERSIQHVYTDSSMSPIPRVDLQAPGTILNAMLHRDKIFTTYSDCDEAIYKKQGSQLYGSSMYIPRQVITDNRLVNVVDFKGRIQTVHESDLNVVHRV